MSIVPSLEYSKILWRISRIYRTIVQDPSPIHFIVSSQYTAYKNLVYFRATQQPNLYLKA